MLAAIELDYQFALAANEIADVAVDRLLSDEFEAGDLAIAQPAPELGFRVGLMNAELPRARCGLAIRSSHRLCPSRGSFHDPASPRKRGEDWFVPYSSSPRFMGKR